MVEIMMDTVVFALGQPKGAPKDVQNRAIQAIARFPRFLLERLLQLVINAALWLDFSHDCDINDDGAVNAVDIQLVINAALGLGTSDQN